MDVQLPEDFCRVEQVVLLENPISVSAGKSSRRLFRFHVLLSVPCQEGQVEDKRDPVPIDEEQEGQESVNGGLGDDVGVEAVAEVDGVDVVAFEVRVHDGEEDLEEEVDGVEEDG